MAQQGRRGGGRRDRDAEPDEISADQDRLDETRHYLHDPDGLLDHARDEDERQNDDLLEIDQTELEELGLVLDDPHQPESE